MSYHVIFLGNPGDRYANTRHNAAWIIADTLFPTGWEYNKYLFAQTLQLPEATVYKPDTYMNESGKVVRALRAKNIVVNPRELIIVHDDCDLPLGQLRSVSNRGEANHNGVVSVTDALDGDRSYIRIRVGVGRSADIPMRAYVLMEMPLEERAVLKTCASRVQEILQTIFTHGLDVAMNRFN